MKPDLLKKQIKMGIAIYPARSAAEHTGPWLLLPLITPQQLHWEHTEWLWTLPELCLWLQAEQERGYLKNVVNIHEISLPPLQHLSPALGTSGKLWRLCLLLVIEREERKENNPEQASQIHKASHTSTLSWDPPRECSKAELAQHCRTCPLPKQCWACDVPPGDLGAQFIYQYWSSKNKISNPRLSINNLSIFS